MTDVEVSADGVSVTKSFETDEFPVPTVTFDVVSDREEAATVRVVDDVPEEFEMDHVGFHPEYGSDDWTAYPDHRVEYERRLEPGESVRTVYGVRIDDPSEGEQFLGEPRVEAEPVGELDAAEDGSEPVEETTMADIAPRDRTDVVRDVASGDADTVPGMDGAETDAEADDESGEPVLGDEPETGEAGPLGGDPAESAGDEDGPGPDRASDDPLNLAEHETAASETPVGLGEDGAADGPETDASEAAADEPATEAGSEPGAETEADSADGDGTAGSEPAVVGAGDESVAAALAAEIRAGEVADDDLAAIRDELGVSRSTDVELDHLQSRVSELEAYTDALEAFIDENGTATELLSSVEDDLEAVDETVADLADEVESGTAARSELRADVTDLRADVDDVEGLGDDVAAVEERLDEIDDALESALTDLDRLRGDLEALDERVSGTEAELDEIEDIEDVEDDVDDLEEDVEELREWREQLTDVFGA